MTTEFALIFPELRRRNAAPESICCQSSGSMHGTLDLQSEVSVGTTVTVRFPAERIVASLYDADSLDLEDRAAG